MMLIGSAKPEHAEQIAGFLAGAFPESVRELTIYGCHGVDQFVLAHIYARPNGTDTFYTVALDSNRVVGCVEMRCLTKELCLNYIAVSPSNRFKGLGRSLLRAAMEAPECRGYSTLVLDVLDFNESAFLWYQRLGFRVFQRRDWYVGGARKALVNKAGLVMGFPQAEAVQARFGFSLFRVVTSRGDYAVGRLGTKWFRVPQADAFSDDELMFSLNRLDSNRQILLIIPQGAQGSALKVAERRLTTNSMRVSMEELFSRLGSPKGQITELE